MIFTPSGLRAISPKGATRVVGSHSFWMEHNEVAPLGEMSHSDRGGKMKIALFKACNLCYNGYVAGGWHAAPTDTHKGGPVMKRLFILAISLLLLAGCGIAQAPEETTTEETTVVTTTEERTTEHQIADAKPFTKDDITAIEAKFKTVGDYVKAVPTAWYRVDHWDAYGCEIIIEFYDQEPNADSWAKLQIRLHDETLCDIIGDKIYGVVQEVPEFLLDAEKIEMHRIEFAKVGSAIPTPRGINVGDPAQKIFEAYPDYRTGNSNVLYDITVLYPGAKLEWGVWDGEGWSNIDFMGGGIMEGGVGFTFTEQPWDWDDRGNDYTWLNMYNPRYLLTYQTQDDIITGIDYMLLYHPG